MGPVFALSVTFVLWIASLVYRRCRRTPLSDIPGPPSRSIFTGHFPELSLTECGTIERKWQEEYGQVVRFKAAFGEDRLWIADCVALKHILQASGYNYKKPDGTMAVSALLTDRGLVWAGGDVHKRQRKIMSPAFGIAESKSFMPVFRTVIGNVIDKWNDQIVAGPSEKFHVFDVYSWLSRAALDAIGTAAFDYDFGAVKELDNPLTKSYRNLFSDAFSAPSSLRLFWENLYNDVPSSILYLIYEVLPGASVKVLRDNRAQVRRLAKKLYADKRNTLRDGGGKDVMSILVKANASENEKTRMRDDEIISQMRTIMLAGHETTATSVTWTLYELAQRPEMQDRLRSEILDMKARARARGDADLTVDDFGNMPYTSAVLKESLRFNPIFTRLLREVIKDDVIPLHTPVTTRSGQVVREIAIAKGTRVVLSVHGYHLNKDLWGPDAHEFNPDRWLSSKNARDVPSIGMYGNLATFSAGVRNCIGWRFALIEMQTFLISLISTFEFSIPEGAKKIRKDRSGVMAPMLEGERESGAQLPLKVSLVSR